MSDSDARVSPAQAVSPEAAPPRLTVVIPTYNRAASLARSIESVLGQTFTDLRLLISDDASPDDTEALCRGYAERDARVHYHRHECNIGPVDNFSWLLAQVDTDYCLMLADDDWLDRDYAEACITLLDADPGLSVVCATDCWDDGASPPDPWPLTELPDSLPARRVLRHLRVRWSSTALYGVMRTSAVKLALPIPNVMGADWLFVTALAFSGRITTTRATHLNRYHGGTSRSFQQIAEVSHLSARAVRSPHLAIAFNQARDIAFSGRSYETLDRPRRIALGLAAAAMLVAGRPFEFFWDAVGPLVLHRRVIVVTGPLRDRWRGRHALKG